MRARIAATLPARLDLWAMLALTFSTGVVDAVGYLGLDHVFTGNMTGNVVILGMGLAGADDLPVAGPVTALAAFMAGAAAGGRLLKGERGWTRRVTALLGVLTVALLLLAVAAIFWPAAASGRLPLLTATLGVVMGAQAAAARSVAVPDVTTVVVTSTLTGLAAESRLGSGAGRGHSARRFTAVALILLGALTGAVLMQAHMGWGLALSALITAGVTLLGVARLPGAGPTAHQNTR